MGRLLNISVDGATAEQWQQTPGSPDRGTPELCEESLPVSEPEPRTLEAWSLQSLPPATSATVSSPYTHTTLTSYAFFVSLAFEHRSPFVFYCTVFHY